MASSSPPTQLTLLKGTFCIHRFPADSRIPHAALTSSFFSITRSSEELSVVLPESVALKSDASEPGWSALKVKGPLDFGLTGILAGISTAMAEASISIFAISTFDTDYILVKSEKLHQACTALVEKGYQVT